MIMHKLLITTIALFCFGLALNADAAILINRPNYLGLTEGLVGFWSFDGNTYFQKAHNNVLDLSGQGNHGVFSNGTSTQVAGKIGQALDFDGSDDHVIRDEGSPVTAYPVTMCAWFKADSLPGATNYQVVAMVGDDSSSGGNPKNVLTLHIAESGVGQLGDNNKIVAMDRATTDGTTGETESSSAAVVGQWYHACGVFVSSTDRSLYVDSVFQSTDTTSAGGLTGSAGRMEAGNWIQTTGDDDPFDGLIDDLRIYNRALSADEIRRLYNMGSTFKINKTRMDTLRDGLVGHWSFDGLDVKTVGSHFRAFDSSGQANHGYWINASTTPVAGKIGQALDFDGSDDYVDIGTGPTSVNTVSFWVYPKTTTEYFINLTGTTDYIWVNGGEVTATGLTSPTVYVDNVVLGTIAKNKWQHVVITTETAENASNLDIGRTQDTNYVEGFLDDVRIYNRALTANEIKRLYNIGATFKINKTRTDTLREGLVGHWSFDGPDMFDTKATDRSGQGNTGVLTNGPLRTAGKIGQALDFDGSNDYVDAGSAASLDNLDFFTYAAWIKLDALPASGAEMMVFTKGAAKRCGIDNRGGANGDNTLRLFVDRSGTGTSLIASDSLISANLWYHIACAFDLNGTHRLYINGVEPSYGTNTQGTVGTGADGSDTVFIGARDAPTDTDFFDGLIDDARIYNRALTADQIKRLYNMGR